ncbi:DNA dC-_dU-editing enzyme APOBEC-3G-like isoform X2 [Eptesicus fuscus]|uniref:DNA dC->dU-editing enzyme APOBEC-3G-like isoform X2 n=1 Tax=Eptesicus fuscus TaxID=29078 RepID=UPI00240439D0|nr:DNA dC->dU-editing enzyme APOBEC-3G-like isoform X2 [Eptesicus fuscus]
MADNPAPRARPLMDIATFEDNFGVKPERKTYLCYEVEVLEGDTWAPMEERQGFLRNQGADTPREPRRHAELCFLDLFPSWGLDRGKQYRLTWYVSWSPRPDCAPELAAFLRENSHVSLRIFAARIYTKVSGYERGLRDLRDAGAQLAIMTLEELQHCWETFVDNQGQAFEPWSELDEHIRAHSQELENILWNRRN